MKYVRWNQSMLVGTRIVTFEAACTIHREKIILSRRDIEGGHLILFEMAVTWELLVGF